MDTSKKIDIKQMLKNYGTVTDEQIREALNRIQIVILDNKGIGTIHGYYTIPKKKIKEIQKDPRSISLVWFDNDVKATDLIENLELYKEIIFYIKSSSRFFLKPDIGEVFDQINPEDLSNINAICVKTDDYIEVDNGNGDHFVMTAHLLKHKQ